MCKLSGKKKVYEFHCSQMNYESNRKRICVCMHVAIFGNKPFGFNRMINVVYLFTKKKKKNYLVIKIPNKRVDKKQLMIFINANVCYFIDYDQRFKFF